MLRRQLAGLIVANMTILTLLAAFSLGVAGPQEKAKNQPPAGETVKERAKPVPQPHARDAENSTAQIAKMLGEYDLTPHPLPTIPDDPPPHEGAMISLPVTVEPPDLVIVEVLDALPGKPISGERMIRPDGKVEIGFYGEVQVRGLTLEQVKVAIIKHLTKYLNDEALGLVTPEFEEQVEQPATPELPAGAVNPSQLDPDPKDNVKSRSSSRIPAIPRSRETRSASRHGAGIRRAASPIRSKIVRISKQGPGAPSPVQNPITIPVGAEGKLTITVELHGQNAPKAEKPPTDPMPQDPPNAFPVDEGKWKVVPPADSDRVFVDMTAYNSKNYYILGDVLITGKMAWTGNETVLDAIQYAGGLLPTAEPKDIRLVRPGHSGKPAKVYKVDLAAIQEKGDVMSNYQIFPNDRLIIGRNDVVKKTTEIDRLSAPIQAITGYISQEAALLRSIQATTSNHRDELMKEFVDFWAKELSRPDGVKFDEKTLREAILRKTKLMPPPSSTAPR
jgi:protein involved in polysaccharide export with SLBB domain